MRLRHLVGPLAALTVLTATAFAQEATPVAGTNTTAAAPEGITSKTRPIVMQYFRPLDKRGLNVFETPKDQGVEYTGFKIDFGAAFAAQFQALDHQNTADPNVISGTNVNQLITIGNGFNQSAANLYLHAQLAKGIRVTLTSYLSSRHHPETWVKDGYVLMDESPIDIKPLNTLMKYATVRVGHMEINYGDAHFRRSDNGNAVYNPFVGNYILDAFTTEIGAEIYLRSKGVIAMGSMTGGEIRGTVLTPAQRSPSYIGKLGFDRQVKPNLRVRLTGSGYKNKQAASNTLYGGDRAGSRYFYVMENTAATESAQATSGLINPGFRNSVTAFQLNPFVKYNGLEFFGVLEHATGKASTEAVNRAWNQYAFDAVYRFFPGEPMYVGARFNKAEGELSGITGDVGAQRWQLAGGWFITPNVLAKMEYVNQKYNGYPTTNIRNGGKFNGVMLEGVVAF